MNELDQNEVIENTELESLNDTEKVNESPSKNDDESSKTTFLTSGWLFTFLLGFGLAFTLFTFIFQIVLTPIKVVGASMQPTINKYYTNGDENYDYRNCDTVFCFKQKSYQTNDIVVIENADNVLNLPLEYNSKTNQWEAVDSIIKRIIACPGEKITFFAVPSTDETEELASSDDETEGPVPEKLYYNYRITDKDGNNKTLDESYLSEPMYINDYDGEKKDIYNKTYFKNFLNMLKTIFEDNEEYEIEIPENSYFVMGDNRNNSTDSRYLNTLITNEMITGKVIFLVEYGENIWVAIWNAIFSNYNIDIRRAYEKYYS